MHYCHCFGLTEKRKNYEQIMKNATIYWIRVHCTRNNKKYTATKVVVSGKVLRTEKQKVATISTNTFNIYAIYDYMQRGITAIIYWNWQLFAFSGSFSLAIAYRVWFLWQKPLEFKLSSFVRLSVRGKLLLYALFCWNFAIFMFFNLCNECFLPKPKTH